MASYHPHTTDGIVIARKNTGEASAWCWILTRDLGLIGAHAQGIRQMTSKLCPHVQLFTYGNFSFIRGKHAWKLVGARKYANIFSQNAKHARTFVHIFSLLKVVIAGEERHPELFEVLENAYCYACENPVTAQEMISLERLVVLRSLYHLGYVSKEAVEGVDSVNTIVTRECLQSIHIQTHLMTRVINNSLRQTQL